MRHNSSQGTKKQKLKSVESSGSLETGSEHPKDSVLSLLRQEKEGFMEPTKRSAFSGQQSSSDMESNSTPNQVGRRKSTPGAFRVGNVHSDDGEASSRSIAADSDSSESCVIVVPRASVVDDDASKDLEANSHDPKPPMVYAERSTDVLEHVPSAEKKKNRKRAFRLCVIILCLLVAGLLGGVLYVTLKEDSPSLSSSSKLSSGDDDKTNGGGRDRPRDDKRDRDVINSEKDNDN
eukprot:scaffold66_cov115-Cylindrotheca_fusiformis.AAC.25